MTASPENKKTPYHGGLDHKLWLMKGPRDRVEAPVTRGLSQGTSRMWKCFLGRCHCVLAHGQDATNAVPKQISGDSCNSAIAHNHAAQFVNSCQRFQREPTRPLHTSYAPQVADPAFKLLYSLGVQGLRHGGGTKKTMCCYYGPSRSRLTKTKQLARTLGSRMVSAQALPPG